MSSTDTNATPKVEDDLLDAEVHLGKALALIHRALPRLAESGWESVVQNSLKGALAHIEAALETHESDAARRPATSAKQTPVIPSYNATIPPEIFAVAAAAAHALFDQPHRIVSIKEKGTYEPSESSLAWSAEGRRLIFSSHRIR